MRKNDHEEVASRLWADSFYFYPHLSELVETGQSWEINFDQERLKISGEVVK